MGIDKWTGHLSAIADTSPVFVTGGKNISGDNWLLKYDLVAKKLLYKLNITEVSQGKYAGFQDVEHDSRGNTYIVGSYFGTILRVDKDGTAIKPWYLPSPLPATTTVEGFGGLAVVGDVLLTNDNASGEILRFDMMADKGVPVVVPATPKYMYSPTDAIYLPPKYKGTVLLVAEDGKGINVLRSKDAKWTSAEYLGLVANDAPEVAGFAAAAPLQMGENLYIVEEFFADQAVPGMLAGNRSKWPLLDITDRVSKLLGE